MHNVFNIFTFLLFHFLSIICAHPIQFHENDQALLISPMKEIKSFRTKGQVHMMKRTTGLHNNASNLEAVCEYCNGEGCSACKDGQTRNRQKNKDEESMKKHHQHGHGHTYPVQSGIKNIKS